MPEKSPILQKNLQHQPSYPEVVMCQNLTNKLSDIKEGYDINDHIMFLDTETTGAGPDAEILQFSLFCPTLKKEHQDVLYTRLGARQSSPYHVLKLHGLGAVPSLFYYPTFTQVAKILYEQLSGAIVGIYNAPFDTRMMYMHTPSDVESTFKIFCVYRLFCEYCKKHGVDLPGKKLENAFVHFGGKPGMIEKPGVGFFEEYQSTSVELERKMSPIDFSSYMLFHDAGYDTRVTAWVFEQIKLNDEELVTQFLSENL